MRINFDCSLKVVHILSISISALRTPPPAVCISSVPSMNRVCITSGYPCIVSYRDVTLACVCIDLAVGAPLEGAGVVYIYRGGPGPISSQYSQRITAADVSRAVGLTNFGHTFGHTPGLDVDANTYPDLLVGAYSSGTVVVLRSKPVVNVHASLSSDADKINPQDTVCHDGQPNTCFQLRICLGFTAEPVDRLVSPLIGQSYSGVGIYFA